MPQHRPKPQWVQELETVLLAAICMAGLALWCAVLAYVSHPAY